ncbi:MAG: phospholipase D-like domain-containing protein [Acidobacteriota bacterium]
MLFLALFEPGLRFKIASTPSAPLESQDFLRMLAALTNATIHTNNRVDVLTNVEVFYEAALEAIRNAKHNINIEVYIFQKGRVAGRFIEALIERAEAGVNVNLVIDAIGSFATWDSYLKLLPDAGARVERYNPIRWYTLPRINNRTHRTLIIVDGRVGFVGGDGVADHWLYGRGKSSRWRDTMFRVEGGAVTDLAVYLCRKLAGSVRRDSGGDRVLPGLHCSGRHQGDGHRQLAFDWPVDSRTRSLSDAVGVGAQDHLHKHAVLRLLASHLTSADIRAHLQRSRTYPGVLPFLHLDHIYFDDLLDLERITLHKSRAALVASDHLPLVADFRIQRE